MSKTPLTREYLQREYVDNIRSACSIAKEAGRSDTYVAKQLGKFGFEVRPRSFYSSVNNLGDFAKQKYTHILTKEYFEEEYVRNNRSMISISEETGISRTAVFNHLRKHGFKIRRGHYTLHNREVIKKLTRDYLEKEYVEKRRSASSISRDFNVDAPVILNRLRQLGFKIRSKKFYYDNRPKTLPSRYKYSHILTREFLEEEYVKKERGASNIGKEHGISHCCVREYIRRHGLSIRDKSFYSQGKRNPLWGKPRSEDTKKKISESNMGNIPWNLGLTKENNAVVDRISKKLTGRIRPEITLDKHPNWRGGLSFEPYGIEFNAELRERIRERDDYMCRVCDKHTDEFVYKLNIHHIDYDKENNVEGNLVSLCRSCHTKTNFNREAWQAYFEKLLENEKCGVLSEWL